MVNPITPAAGNVTSPKATDKQAVTGKAQDQSALAKKPAHTADDTTSLSKNASAALEKEEKLEGLVQEDLNKQDAAALANQLKEALSGQSQPIANGNPSAIFSLLEEAA
ncbi:hypothetical protein [Kordiimonas pumila]|uniref:Anti-sigma-28 factor FlgM C-terminal domain-containing protein n=1 Tax=Kordiimonas pumila TaxID=2161677 RepID=A0ABV7D4B7_9PROT|nr:hypothetical protein [Kordiimonas pumila]